MPCEVQRSVAVSSFEDADGKVPGRHRGRVRDTVRLGIARQFRAAGMHVVIADIEEAVLQRAAAEIGALGVRTDVRDADSVQALAASRGRRHF